MALPIIAIVGRPNVGKSTLFNKLSGKRISIVEDTPGVTRDRILTDIEWNGRLLTLADTGGIEPKTDSQMLRYMRAQAELAIDEADVIVFMTDLTASVTADDREIATMLRKSRKPVILAVNKVDSTGDLPLEFYEFYELGIDDPIPLSSLHGTGTGDLLDRVCELLPPDENYEKEDEGIKVAVIGKPNAGKSSLINKILGSERLIVSDIPGTTRDSVDTRVERGDKRYTFIDTAGIRRASKIDESIEFYSVTRSKLAVRRADVCILLIDGVEGISEQDTKIAGVALESGKPTIIAVNKWDAVEDKDNSTVKNYTAEVYRIMSFLTYAPLTFISAKSGQRVENLFKEIDRVYDSSMKRISTGTLNDFLAEATVRAEPPSDRGKRLKIYYMTQTSVAPPTFVIFCNDKELFHFSYQRYIENRLRETFDFYGTPIKLNLKMKNEKD